MNGKIPSQLRLLFPLTPVFAVFAMSVFSVPQAAKNSPRESAKTANSRTPLLSSGPVEPCCQKIVRAEAPPKYDVKFISASRGAVDYDAGNALVAITCAFTDGSTDKPVVAMSDVGLVQRLQTDAGTLFESGSGSSLINPAIREFKNAQFTLQAKVPLAAKSVRVLSGEVTVLRTSERAAMVWNEPLAKAIGSVRKESGFEFTLTKCAAADGVVTAEWTYKIPIETENEKQMWELRNLKAALTCADNTAIDAAKVKETPGVIHRTFKLSKKVPASLELSFVSEMKLENLPFELNSIVLEATDPKKKVETAAGENF